MELSLIPTSELVDELIKRHDAVVVTGVKFTKHNGEYVTFRRAHGNRFVCSGLVNMVNHVLALEELTQSTPMTNNEDR